MDIQNISKLMKKHWDGQIPVDVKKNSKKYEYRTHSYEFR